MKSFDYVQADSIDDAVQKKDATRVFYAGGTDLLTLMKQDIIAPSHLIDIKRSDLPRGIEVSNKVLRIGALTTLSELEAHSTLLEEYPLIAQAVSQAATPQLRNRATLAGNLLQRPRCWYYRHRDINCWLKGGDDCPAKDGQNQQHAIFNSSPCHAVHPSDLAPALLALDASVNLHGPDGERTLSLQQFYAAPEGNRRVETQLKEHELITSVDVPTLPAGSHSLYLKAMDRKVWAFALVSVAAVRSGNSWRLALGGVAAVPRRLQEVESMLHNAANDQEVIASAAAKAVADAHPLEHNGYKVDLTRRLVSRALNQLSGN